MPVHRPLHDWAEVVLSRPDLFTVWSFYVLAVIRQTSASKLTFLASKSSGKSFLPILAAPLRSALMTIPSFDLYFPLDVLFPLKVREELSSDIGRSIKISIDDNTVF